MNEPVKPVHRRVRGLLLMRVGLELEDRRRDGGEILQAEMCGEWPELLDAHGV